MSYTEDRAAVKRLTKQIDQAETEADAWNWERAERLARMCETKTQREVGDDVGLPHQTVSRHTRIWKQFGALARQDRPKYADAFASLPSASAQHGKRGGRTPREKEATVLEVIEDIGVTPAMAEAFQQAEAEQPKQRRQSDEQPVEMDSWFDGINTLWLCERTAKRAAAQLDNARITSHRQEELDEAIDSVIGTLRALRTRDGRAKLRVVAS